MESRLNLVLDNSLWKQEGRMSTSERSVILVGKPCQNTVNLQKCVTCQKEKPSEKPVSTENGRAKLISTSKSLDDGLLTG